MASIVVCRFLSSVRQIYQKVTERDLEESQSLVYKLGFQSTLYAITLHSRFRTAPAPPPAPPARVVCARLRKHSTPTLTPMFTDYSGHDTIYPLGPSLTFPAYGYRRVKVVEARGARSVRRRVRSRASYPRLQSAYGAGGDVHPRGRGAAVFGTPAHADSAARGGDASLSLRCPRYGCLWWRAARACAPPTLTSTRRYRQRDTSSTKYSTSMETKGTSAIGPVALGIGKHRREGSIFGFTPIPNNVQIQYRYVMT
ncbi:hypothetical protein EVAR_44417_1 [Eumeta japonica]|uniref:Uncharacterized protein n=1 Tax=Eumeta variegata TaxID=151549 RepID=A0A4C1XRH9_EUMVA|nr:hypothetical protein EVAR_44417_1 [Eumeta japonica]